MTLRVLIVDDEPLARQRLAALVRECTEPRCEVVAECANARQAAQWLDEHGGGDDHPGADALLLDIQMPGATGIDFAAELKRRCEGARAPAVVFVTAHGEHALAAFDLDAADYLTKPVKRDRLHAALQRAARRAGERAATPEANTADATTPVLVVSERGRVVRVPLAEVLYLKAELKYVTLRTASRSFVLDDPLTDLEQRLGERVLRIHRNALVARHAVRALERRRLADAEDEAGGDGAEIGWAVQVAATGEWLAVSRRQAGAVREALEQV
jgi:two-component system, LytTR family, response regulator AlgR